MALATGLYFWTNASLPHGPRGGTLPGLIFGLIAALLMVYAGLLGARRRFPSARLGSGAFWLRSHLWIGTLTVPFALFHAGFGLGGGLEIVLWLLFFAVILSGFWGLALQNILPRMMLENIPRETFIQQIPHLCLQFVAQSDAAVAMKCGHLGLPLTPEEVVLFEKSLQPIFEDVRKADRVSYPTNKGESEATQFTRFLNTIYQISTTPTGPSGGGPRSAIAADMTNSAAPLKETAVLVTSVNRITSPRSDSSQQPDREIAAGGPPGNAPSSDPVLMESKVPEPPLQTTLVESPPVKAKPDLAAMRAAALAKKAAATSKPAPENQIDSPSTTQSSDPVPTLSSNPPPPNADSVPLPQVKPKPDLAAMRAAALAKAGKTPAAVTEQVTPTSVGTETVAAAPVQTEVTSGGDIPAPSAKPKPDLAAMRAAALAKAGKTPAAVADQVTPTSVSNETVAPATVQADVTAGDDMPAPSVKPKPDLAAMRAAALAKAGKTPAVSAATEVTSIPQQSITTKPVPVSLPALSTPAKPKVTTAKVGTVSAVTPKPTSEQMSDFKQFYLKMIRPWLGPRPENRNWNEGIARGILAARVRSAGEHPFLESLLQQLQDCCEQRQQFALVQRYHRWLHGWLIIHIPATVAVYLVLVVHIIAALRVIPFGN